MREKINELLHLLFLDLGLQTGKMKRGYEKAPRKQLKKIADNMIENLIEKYTEKIFSILDKGKK